MQGLIIINAHGFSENTFKQVSAVKSKFDLLNVKVDIRTNADILAYVNEEGNIESSFINNYDFVVYLDKDPYIALMIERSGVRMFNKASSIYLCDDKMLTHITLASHGIKMPKTISSPLVYDKFVVKEFKDKLLKEFSFPLIIKEVYGSLGLKVYLVHDENELSFYMEKLVNVPHIYQQFISSSFGKDVRIIVINHKVVASMERSSKNDFRSNISLGGIGKKIKLSKEFEEVAIKASKILGLDYCGIDILYGPNDEPILCEVNSNAFFEHISKISEVDVALEYAKYIVKTMKRRKSSKI